MGLADGDEEEWRVAQVRPDHNGAPCIHRQTLVVHQQVMLDGPLSRIDPSAVQGLLRQQGALEEEGGESDEVVA